MKVPRVIFTLNIAIFSRLLFLVLLMEIGNPTTSLSVDTVQSILKKAFKQDAPKHFVIESSETMGFSGAGVANLSLQWDDSTTSTKGGRQPTSLFLKHVVIPKPATASSDEILKIERNVQSYKNEFASITCLYPLMDASIPPLLHPHVYFNDEASTEESSTFSVCAENMFASGWTQTATLTDRRQIDACIEYLANFHALTIGKESAPSSSSSSTSTSSSSLSLSTMVPGLWSSGTHLALEKRPSNELDTLSEIWENFIIAFEGQHEVFAESTQNEIIDLGD